MQKGMDCGEPDASNWQSPPSLPVELASLTRPQRGALSHARSHVSAGSCVGWMGQQVG